MEYQNLGFITIFQKNKNRYYFQDLPKNVCILFDSFFSPVALMKFEYYYNLGTCFVIIIKEGS